MANNNTFFFPYNFSSFIKASASDDPPPHSSLKHLILLQPFSPLKLTSTSFLLSSSALVALVFFKVVSPPKPSDNVLIPCLILCSYNRSRTRTLSGVCYPCVLHPAAVQPRDPRRPSQQPHMSPPISSHVPSSLALFWSIRRCGYHSILIYLFLQIYYTYHKVHFTHATALSLLRVYSAFYLSVTAIACLNICSRIFDVIPSPCLSSCTLIMKLLPLVFSTLCMSSLCSLAFPYLVCLHRASSVIVVVTLSIN